MSFSVTPNMVQSFNIGRCQERSPCGHSCTITLSDGKEKKAELDGDEVLALISVINDSKIVGSDLHFFRDYKDHNITHPKIPSEILSKIFNK